MLNKQKCLELLQEYNLPEGVIKHVTLVAKVARFLAEELKKKGVEVNVDLVENAALLHDIDKMLVKEKGIMFHAKISQQILKDKGLNEIAEIARKHIVSSVLEEETKPKTWEEKIVFYADKRVSDKIISIDDRLSEWEKTNKELILKCKPFVLEIEKEIFSMLDFRPEELKEKIENG